MAPSPTSAGDLMELATGSRTYQPDVHSGARASLPHFSHRVVPWWSVAGGVADRIGDLAFCDGLRHESSGQPLARSR